MRLLAPGNRRLTIENPSGASGSGGKMASAFAAALGRMAVEEEERERWLPAFAEVTGRRGRREGNADSKETIELLLHSGDVLGKAAAKLHESLKAFTREVAEQKNPNPDPDPNRNPNPHPL